MGAHSLPEARGPKETLNYIILNFLPPGTGTFPDVPQGSSAGQNARKLNFWCRFGSLPAGPENRPEKFYVVSVSFGSP